MKRALIAIGMVPLVLVLTGANGGGCGGTDSDGTSGSGGGGSAASCDLPQCFLDLMADCMPTGACTQESSGDVTNAVANACYENGVKMSTTMSFSGSAVTSHLTAYKVDGSVCFTADGATGSSGNKTEYKDVGGATVVTVEVGLTGGDQTYTCGGKTFTVKSTGCPGSSDGGSGCTKGSCTVP